MTPSMSISITRGGEAGEVAGESCCESATDDASAKSASSATLSRVGENHLESMLVHSTAKGPGVETRD